MVATTRKITPVRERRSTCPEGYLPAGDCVPIHLTFKQEAYCRRALGISRFVYNLCVATHRFCRTNRIPWPSWQDLYQEFNSCKRDNYPFATEVGSRVAEGAFMDFGKALKNWWDPRIKAGPPRFKKRSRTGAGSFRAASGVAQMSYNGKRRIKLTGLGSVKLLHTLPEGIIHEAHIKRRNGRWFVGIKFWKPPMEQPEFDTRIPSGAVDTGINPLATDSEGQTWENPKAYYQTQRKLQRWQRAQARRVPYSRGWWEAQRRIDRLHRRTTGLRKNAQHQMTSQLVNKFRNLVVEDLNVSGMMQGNAPKAQADAGMAEINRQLTYKGQWNHCNIILAPRFYPSSKTCSVCQEVHVKLKRERFWQCPGCAAVHERNINAAVNLRNLLTLPAGSGVKLRDGKALAVGPADDETGPKDRRTATPEPSPARLTVCSASERQVLSPSSLNVNTP